MGGGRECASHVGVSGAQWTKPENRVLHADADAETALGTVVCRRDAREERQALEGAIVEECMGIMGSESEALDVMVKRIAKGSIVVCVDVCVGWLRNGWTIGKVGEDEFLNDTPPRRCPIARRRARSVTGVT
jgi:hypothetical protein